MTVMEIELTMGGVESELEKSKEQLARERNREAVKKCRKRKRDHHDFLVNRIAFVRRFVISLKLVCLSVFLTD